MRAPAAPGPLAVATAGVGMVAVTYGMGRNGYGLLLPDMRAAYGLGTGVVGTIAAGSYLGYLATTVAAGSYTSRLGARTLTVAGGVLAAGGMLLVALSPSPSLLIVGVLVAGASPGLVYPPFAEAVADLPPGARGRAISAINCGTGYGVALAAPIAILVGSAWRTAWVLFAGVTLLATAWAAYVLPAAAPGTRRSAPVSWRGVMRPGAARMLAAGLLVGAGASVYWTFAVDYLDAAGGLSATWSRLFFGVVGVASVLATFSADVARRVGAGRSCVAATSTAALALVLLAAIPSSPAAALASAVLFGVAYTGAVAIQVMWSAEVFASAPALGLAAVMFSGATGLLLGPLVAGLLAGPFGQAAIFYGAAAVVAAAGTLAPRSRLSALDPRLGPTPPSRTASRS